MRRRAVAHLATLLALLAALGPAPSLELAEVVQTQMRRVDDTPAAVAGGYVSPPIDLGLDATSLGAHWTRARDATAGLALRTSPDGAAWGDWHELEAEATVDEADGRVRVVGALAVGLSGRFAQYRVDGAAETVSLFGLDSASQRRTVLRPRLEAAGRAEASIKPLGIVGRAQWGADESLRFGASEGQTRAEIWPEQVARVERIVVHHTAGPNVCASPEPYCQRRSVTAINDIYHYHTVANGWGDIGYNSLVGYDGRIYEGRHGPEPLGSDEPIAAPVVGAHAEGYNTRTHGIALMGNFDLEPVPDLQYEALTRMVGWIVRSQLANGPLDPTGRGDFVRATGQVHPALPTIVGHRDVEEGYTTECPGQHLYARLDDLRARVKRLVEWPPLSVELRAQVLDGGDVAYHVLVDNHEPELVRGLTIKGAVPANADIVDSWAGSPTQNRGKFDGSTVTWYAPDGALAPGLDRREHVFVVRPKPGVPAADVRTTAWVEFGQPAGGVAMSEVVGADAPVDLVVDPVVRDRTFFSGNWTSSRNVAGYYGDDYLVARPGTGGAVYTWEARLPVAGQYEVLAWWTAELDRATNAPFTVQARDGARTVRVSQRQGGFRWESLGTFAFEAGPSRVMLSDDADGVVIADALRFRRVK